MSAPGSRGDRQAGAPSLRALPDRLLRPLGKGYHDIHLLCEKLLNSSAKGALEAPGLAESLRVVEAEPGWRSAVGSLPSTPRCLIEGMTHPHNGSALRDCLRRHGVDAGRIDSIDICDTRQMFAVNDIEMPEVHFRVADALDLHDVFAAESFDLVVLDGLLNCAPFAGHEQLIAETSRLAHDGALLLCNVTDSNSLSDLPQTSPAELLDEHGLRWDAQAYGLSDIVNSPQALPELLRALGGTIVVVGGGDGSEARTQHTAITSRHGHFEFYPRVADALELLTDAGFALRIHASATERDSNGFDCRRHRLVLQKRGA